VELPSWRPTAAISSGRRRLQGAGGPRGGDEMRLGWPRRRGDDPWGRGWLSCGRWDALRSPTRARSDLVLQGQRWRRGPSHLPLPPVYSPDDLRRRQCGPGSNRERVLCLTLGRPGVRNRGLAPAPRRGHLLLTPAPGTARSPAHEIGVEAMTVGRNCAPHHPALLRLGSSIACPRYKSLPAPDIPDRRSSCLPGDRGERSLAPGRPGMSGLLS
jgi:hypothetical protein